MSLVFFLCCWNYTEVPAWRRHIDEIFSSERWEAKSLASLAKRVSSPTAGSAWRPGSLLLSGLLSAPTDLLQAGGLAREAVAGWATWNIFPCVIHVWWGAGLWTDHPSYDRYHLWLNLTVFMWLQRCKCSCYGISHSFCLWVSKFSEDWETLLIWYFLF